MRVGNAALIISPGHERDSGHVEMIHGTTYTVKLINHWNDRATDVELSIDGKDQGTYQLQPEERLELQCSHLDAGRFTFFRADSEEGSAAGGQSVTASDKGLIVARFKPERKRSRVVLEDKLREWAKGRSEFIPTFNPMRGTNKEAGLEGTVRTQSMGMAGRIEDLSSGVTGLTGRSDQRFHTVPSLRYDPSEEATITVRLVAAPAVRSLATTIRSNPFPEPV
jgi:hypothetical protein